MIFSIEGKPNALQRHRSVRMGTFIRQYDPSVKDKEKFLALAMPFAPKVPYDEPLFVRLVFRFQRPKNHYRTGKFSHIRKDNAPHWHTKVPDADNLAKFVCDALNKVFWKDDSCICEMEIEKVYSEAEPSTDITISTMHHLGIGLESRREKL